MRNIKLTGEALTNLFQKIGGEPALQQILDSFYAKMSQDVLIGFFFTGKDIKHIAQQQKAFLMKAWGVTSSYQGKSPATAHEKLPPILAGHFDRRLVILAETLRAFKIDENSIDTWVGFENKFRQAVQS